MGATHGHGFIAATSMNSDGKRVHPGQSIRAAVDAAGAEPSMRERVTVENWDKGGGLSHWVYTHASEVFPSKAFVTTALAILEDQGRIDLQKPVENFLPELKASAWAGTRLRDIADMASGMEGEETGNDVYRDPAHKQFQLEATLAGSRAQRRTSRSRRGAAISSVSRDDRSREEGG